MLAGLTLLVLGGEVLVRGASALARRLGLSALIVGLTVVAVATSAPELAVTTGAVLRDEPELALGNVVGSNIGNILLILGIAALLVPLAVRRRLVRVDVPLMVLLTAVLLLMASDGSIGRLDGALLLAAFGGYLVLTVVLGRREAEAETGTTETAGAAETRDNAAPEDAPAPVPRALGAVVLGIALLVGGARLLVDGATQIAEAFGVSNLVIGLTVVAIGTSLPELAVSVLAALRGRTDLAVGNIVGSNIVNIGLVLGFPALLADGGLPVPAEAVALDLPLMLAAAAALLPIAFTGFVVARWEGGLFLVLYAAYVTFLILAATQHAALSGYTSVMGGFVLPLVAATLIAFAAHELHRHRRARRAAPDTDDPT